MQCNVEPQCSGNTDFLKFSVLGNLRCAQETRWLRVAWWTRAFESRSSNWIIPNTAHAQSVDYLRVRRCMYGHAILITQIPWVYVSVHRATRRSVLEVPQHMSDFQNRKLSKNFPTKNTSWYLLMRERDKRLTWPKRIWRFHSESVRGSLMRVRFVRWDCTQ